MLTLPLLLLLPFTATQASSEFGLVSVCLIYDTAFPHGHEAADLTQDLCHLVQENLPEMQCEDNGENQFGTGSDFVEQVYNKQAEFCEQNKGITSTGGSADAQMLREIALAEMMFMVPKSEGSDRRSLFMDDVVEFVEDTVEDVVDKAPASPYVLGGDWNFGHWTWVCYLDVMIEFWGSQATCGNWMFLVGGAFAWSFALSLYNDGRRALTEGSAPSSIVINANSIFTQCSNGLQSYICNAPVNDILHFFNTGICASTIGMLCVVHQDDLLALAAPQP